MILGLLARIDVWYAYGESGMDFRDYYQHIYYSSFTRFDELLPGIAIAILKNFHPNRFANILNRANWAFFLGVVIIGTMFYVFPHYHATAANGYNFLLSTLGYSWVAIGFALLTVSAISPRSLLGKTRIPGAAHVALWSYAIYLLHKPMFQLLITPLFKINIDVKSSVGVSIVLGLSVFSGWLLFNFVESPVMSVREKYFRKKSGKAM